MSLTPNTRLGPFEIVSPLGAGGMGEVYRARDTRLDREVAIKVLPDLFARDPERVGRFQREAKLLASLNHPNIAAIHGFEEVEGKRLLVMELVEGATLADRLHDGALSVEDALTIGRQIAEALEAAHERGIIHRDLKPANVKITPDGAVKVLDFGLAKAMTDELSASQMADSPTITVQHTRPGVVLGTAAYMSPEQARGKSVDKRTDIWSFGVVLFECLGGCRPFEGETASDLIAQILEREPNWSVLPLRTPPTLRLLLQRCLAKDRNRRLRDFGDIRLDLDDTSAIESSEANVCAQLAETTQERDLFRFIVNVLLPEGNLQAAPPIQAARLQSMADIHESLQYLLLEYASPRLLPDDVAYFAYRMNRSIPMIAAEIEQIASKEQPEKHEWAFQMAICNRQRGLCRPGLKMHDRSNIARVNESGLADPYAHKADADYEDRNQSLIGERYFRAFPVKIMGASVGVVGLSAGSTTDDQLTRFGRMGTNLSLVFALIFEVFALRTFVTRGRDLATDVRTAIANFYDGLLPKSQIA